MLKNWGLCLLVLFAAACVDVELKLDLRSDGAGELDYRLIANYSLITSKYAVIERNALLPLDEAAISAFAERFNGAQLLSYNIDEVEIDGTAYLPDNRYRRINLKLGFDDINAIRTNHMGFVHYELEGKRYMLFRIQKKIPANAGGGPSQPAAGNDIIEVLGKGRNLVLQANLPGKIVRHNGKASGWNSIEWEIPIVAIGSDAQADIIAWAEYVPAEQNWIDSGLSKAKIALGTTWLVAPDRLPAQLLANPRFNQSNAP